MLLSHVLMLFGTDDIYGKSKDVKKGQPFLEGRFRGLMYVGLIYVNPGHHLPRYNIEKNYL